MLTFGGPTGHAQFSYVIQPDNYFCTTCEHFVDTSGHFGLENMYFWGLKMMIILDPLLVLPILLGTLGHRPIANRAQSAYTSGQALVPRALATCASVDHAQSVICPSTHDQSSNTSAHLAFGPRSSGPWPMGTCVLVVWTYDRLGTWPIRPLAIGPSGPSGPSAQWPSGL